MAIYGIGNPGLTIPARIVRTEHDAITQATDLANIGQRPVAIYVSYASAGGEDIWLEEDVVHPDPRTDTEPPHLPRRGSDVEAWINRWADSYTHDSAGRTALERILADYRDRADTVQNLTDTEESR